MDQPAPPPPRPANLWVSAPIANVRRVYAVGSGKGGVGKSTISLQLALAAARMGKRVGLLDADIYGPSLPHMMGLNHEPDIREGNMIPLKKHGVECQSIGLITGDQPALLRGPMISKTLQQLVRGTHWGSESGGELDLLIIDMPPGTGDVHLSLAQNVLLDGAIIVTTPQKVALIDARKAVGMFQRAGVPIAGVIENMSGMQQADGSMHYPFGQGGGATLAQEAKTPLLATLPFYPEVMEACDSGEPVMPNNHPIHALLQLAFSQFK